MGCVIVLLNEAEYFVRQLATFRSIEAMWCIEYYKGVDTAIAALGKHIPERLCKLDSIEKRVAETTATMMLIRKVFAFVGAVPLGRLADRIGRKFVIVMHLVNVLCNNAVILATCAFLDASPFRTSSQSGMSHHEKADPLTIIQSFYILAFPSSCCMPAAPPASSAAILTFP